MNLETVPSINWNAPMHDVHEQAEELAAYLNARLREARTLADVEQLRAAGDDAVKLTSIRRRWGATREMFAFTSSLKESLAAGSGHYIADLSSTRVAYLYDDSASRGEADVKNLWRVGRFQPVV